MTVYIWVWVGIYIYIGIIFSWREDEDSTSLLKILRVIIWPCFYIIRVAVTMYYSIIYADRNYKDWGKWW